MTKEIKAVVEEKINAIIAKAEEISEEVENAKKVSGIYFSERLTNRYGIFNEEYGEYTKAIFIEEGKIVVENGECYPPKYTVTEFFNLYAA